MAKTQRGTKAVGGTAFIDGTGNAILAAEVNTDFDNVYNVVNGQIDSENISPTAGIPNSALDDILTEKVDDHAATDAEYMTVTTPGDTGTTSKPTDLAEELERMRYRIAANRSLLSTAQYRDSAGVMQDAGWTEPPAVGRNLFPNPGFEVQSGLALSAPDGWSLVGDPSTLVIVAAADPEMGVDKRSLRIVTDAINEGISRTVTGLKPDTKYVYGVNYTLSGGRISVATGNALGSGDYQDLQFTDATTSADPKTFQGIFKTDASGTDVVASILGLDSADDINLHYVWLYELSDGTPVEIPSIPMQTAVDDTELYYPLTPTTGQHWDAIAPLSMSQYIPCEGYRLVYEATLSWAVDELPNDAPDNSLTEYQHSARIQLDSGSGAATVEGPYVVYYDGVFSGVTGANGHTIALKYMVDNPTPGLTYSFTTDLGVYITAAVTSAYAILNPLRNSQQSVSTARLYIERL